ncbi:MAG: acyltransferase [Clostridia bacterium]|nr:acyltransferase [Clostridia bacterium]
MEKTGLKKERDSNLELFRIVTMLFIIAHHYVVNSGLGGSEGLIFSNYTSWRSLFLLCFGAFGKTGINCFVMITGYFMCKSNITLKKFLKLLLEVMFYKIGIYLIFCITGYTKISLFALLDAIIPTREIAGNFTGTYLVFFLAIPFLNALIRNLNEKQHIRLILLSCFVYVFFGNIIKFSVQMNYFSWYMVIYFIASYIRLYPKDLFNNKKLCGLMFLTSVLLSLLSVIALAFIGKKLNMNLSYFFMSDTNAIFAVTNGITGFLFFKNLEIKQSRFINAVASTTFGVFLIHASSNLMRKWLWEDVLNNVGVYSSKYMPIHAVCSVMGIFIVCSAIDYLRIKFIEKPAFKFINSKIKD